MVPTPGITRLDSGGIGYEWETSVVGVGAEGAGEETEGTMGVYVAADVCDSVCGADDAG